MFPAIFWTLFVLNMQNKRRLLTLQAIHIAPWPYCCKYINDTKVFKVQSDIDVKEHSKNLHHDPNSFPQSVEETYI